MLDIELPEDNLAIPREPRPYSEAKVSVRELRAAVKAALEEERRDANKPTPETSEEDAKRKAKFGHAFGESRRLAKMHEEPEPSSTPHAPETQFWVDLSGNLLGCGRDWSLVTGRSWEDIKGLGWASLFTAGDCLRLDVLWRKFIADRLPCESRVHLRDPEISDEKGVAMTLALTMDGEKFSRSSVRINLHVDEAEVASLIPVGAEAVHQPAERWGGLPIIGMVKILAALLIITSLFLNLDLTAKSQGEAEAPVRNLPAERAERVTDQEKGHDLVVAFHQATSIEEKLP